MRLYSTLLVIVLLAILSSCQNKNEAQLRIENDSLRNQLKITMSLIQGFRDVNQLMDSISINRNFRQVSARAPFQTTMSDKLRDINDYVLQSEARLTFLDKEIKTSKFRNSAYINMIDALKSELQLRMDEVSSLEEIVSKYQRQTSTSYVNANRERELQSIIDEKDLRIASLEAQLSEQKNKHQLTEADIIYARAQSVEASARKVKLAPIKKKEMLTEALELYKKARLLGKVEADKNIATLEKSATL